MLKFYQNTNTNATRQARESLEGWGIDFDIVRMDAGNGVFTKREFFKILSCLDTGVYTLLSTRSKTYEKVILGGEIDIDDLKLSEVYELIKMNPHILKTPIIVDYDEDRVVIGSDEDKLCKFNSLEFKRQRREDYRKKVEEVTTEDDIA